VNVLIGRTKYVVFCFSLRASLEYISNYLQSIFICRGHRPRKPRGFRRSRCLPPREPPVSRPLPITSPSLHSVSFGVPRIELGLQDPQPCVLPLYDTPVGP